MERLVQPRLVWALIALTLFSLLSQRSEAAETLNWNTNDNRVSADIQSVPLTRLLEGVAKLTGWHVYLESNSTFNVSAKFKDLPSGQALRHLLGALNFALVPQTNSNPRLYVFHSSQKNATMLMQPADLNARKDFRKPIANELVITLKRGAKIENLACLQATNVVGRIDGLNIYRVKFEDEAATQVARNCLANNNDVESIDSNFSMEQPLPTMQLDANIAPDINLKLKEPSGDCDVIVAVLDTRGMQAVPSSLNKFFMPGISVADESQAATASASPSELTHGLAMVETLMRGVQANTAGNTSMKILPVDVYGNYETTSTFLVAQGIYAAVNQGANIVNLSLGSSGDSTVLHNLIKQASDQGVVFFSAAGNEPVTTPVYPAAYPEVVAVTAGDRNGQVANYANRGNFVDIMTPGTSLVPFNGASYIVNGTSAATAYASGIAAGLADSTRNCPSKVVPTMRSRLGVNFGNGQ